MPKFEQYSREIHDEAHDKTTETLNKVVEEDKKPRGRVAESFSQAFGDKGKAQRANNRAWEKLEELRTLGHKEAEKLNQEYDRLTSVFKEYESRVGHLKEGEAGRKKALYNLDEQSRRIGDFEVSMLGMGDRENHNERMAPYIDEINGYKAKKEWGYVRESEWQDQKG
ncbi:MAG: hypothetical protein HY093_05055 [Candidatus Liptonbacteria bacterium]|nr:hypothetical protein [Candidatus Liptonbacteria bacterium]